MKRIFAFILAAALLMAGGCAKTADRALEAIANGDIETVTASLAKLSEEGDAEGLQAALDALVEAALPALKQPATFKDGMAMLELAGQYTDLAHLLAFKTSLVDGVSDWAYFWGNYISDKLNGTDFTRAVASSLTEAAKTSADMASLRVAAEAMLAQEYNRALIDELTPLAETEEDKLYFVAVNTYYSLACETVFGVTELDTLGLWGDMWFNTMIAVVNDGVTLDAAVSYTYSLIASMDGSAENINAEVLKLIRSCCFLNFADK